MSGFTVRPTNSDKDPFRIKLTAAALLGLRVKSGDLVAINLITDASPDENRLAIAWEASGGNMKDTIVQTSKLLQELYDFRLGDRLTIARSQQIVQDTRFVTLRPFNWTQTFDNEKRAFWEQYARITLSSTCEYLANLQPIRFSIERESQEFYVESVGISARIARVTNDTEFRVLQGEFGSSQHMTIKFDPKSVGGLAPEIKHLQLLIHRLVQFQSPRYLRPCQGILIYGSKGTGKTCFITALSQCGWHLVINWKPGSKMKTHSTKPSLIIVEAKFLKNTTIAIKEELEELFKSIVGFPTLVVGETKHPNEVEQSLRSLDQFAVEIELPIPTSIQRQEILLAIRGDHATPNKDFLLEMARRTHGYVGADLYLLMRETMDIASERGPDEVKQNNIEGSHEHENLNNVELVLKPQDLIEAMQQIRPSALQEIFLERPNIHWSEIGGQHEIKRQLQNAVERSLTQADRMRGLGLKPKKGILLYGPPGCSKTLLVRALATEAGVNFLAVKGAELVSMYVGESERATREVFRKARAASPSIIFFDEIDSIASRNRNGGSNSDLNVLTTLLNEMDGFEELRNVLVVAATNKPENIDPALLRPGRFDNVVYIGPPDLEARTEIFQARFERYNYQPDHETQSKSADAQNFAAQTSGFSGAEIVAICHTAAEYAMDNDRGYFTADDISKAIPNTRKGISDEMILEFEAWNTKRFR